jgi:hypothetical protein
VGKALPVVNAMTHLRHQCGRAFTIPNVLALVAFAAFNLNTAAIAQVSNDKPATAEIDGKPVQIAPNSIYFTPDQR